MTTPPEHELTEIRARRHRNRLIVGVCVVMAMLLGLLAFFYFHDGPPPDDADLMVRDPVVPAEQNGLAQLWEWKSLPNFPVFAHSRGVDEETADNILRGTATNGTLVDEFLAQSRPTFEQLDAILAQPYFVNNEPVRAGGAFAQAGRMITLAHMLALSARRNQQMGRYAEAARDDSRLRRLSVRLVEGHVLLIDFLTACALRGMAADAALRLLNDPALPPAARDELAAAWKPFSWTEALRRDILTEYQFGSAMMDGLKKNANAYALSGNAAMAQWFQLTLRPNDTRRWQGDLDRAWRFALRGPYAAIKFSALESGWPGAKLTSGPMYYLAVNYGGRVIMEGQASSLKGIARIA